MALAVNASDDLASDSDSEACMCRASDSDSKVSIGTVPVTVIPRRVCVRHSGWSRNQTRIYY
jgi:hypothetical protein